ncbi:DUF2612 domain-containing protein [Pseudomonas chlororaphis]|uniref:DUF2612 domain-containing protein n=1 Tax=Pseudomonas chlororaphis TaxID=587753 RepID=UPI0015DF7A13|nr:DUF2612 domain-containing protein [Pseudomonas chlororaphis]QLL11692.1 DUF2612 domain-containing protein [Pseudomonas chlororaphis subsp. aurantiaca]
MATIKDYTGKITSEHSDKPKYMAMVEAVSQCFLDTNSTASSLSSVFDLDDAVGVQLDDIGLWVGISRNVRTPLTGVYFSLDVSGLGFDQGVWQGPFDPDSGVTRLDDDTYRLLIRARIGANRWDGTMEQSKEILDLVFSDGTFAFIQDNQDMTMTIGVAGVSPSALELALLTGGYIPIKPQSVGVDYYIISTEEGPLFGFDAENQYIAGFDQGSWGKIY